MHIKKGWLYVAGKGACVRFPIVVGNGAFAIATNGGICDRLEMWQDAAKAEERHLTHWFGLKHENHYTLVIVCVEAYVPVLVMEALAETINLVKIAEEIIENDIPF